MEITLLQSIALVAAFLMAARLRVTWYEARMSALALQMLGKPEYRTDAQVRSGSRKIFIMGIFFALIIIPLSIIKLRPAHIFCVPTWGAVHYAAKLMMLKDKP